MHSVNGSFAILTLIALTGCSGPEPDLAELQAACTAGQAGACQAHQDLQDRIRRTQSGIYAGHATGTGQGLNCQQGFEGELECPKN